MIKEAIEYIVKLGNVERTQIGNQEFSTQPLHLIKEPVAQAITLHTLSGFVDYVKSQFDTGERLMIHVEDEQNVRAYSALNSNAARSVFVQAKALLPRFNYGSWYDAENFNIALQANFLNKGDRANILKIVGNLKDENVTTYGDDGVSQQVTAKVGIAAVENVPVPNPVLLYPYRTFVEIEQPESKFVFRMRKGGNCALFEADGGDWQNQAIASIRAYLDDALKGVNVVLIS